MGLCLWLRGHAVSSVRVMTVLVLGSKLPFLTWRTSWPRPLTSTWLVIVRSAVALLPLRLRLVMLVLVVLLALLLLLWRLVLLMLWVRLLTMMLVLVAVTSIFSHCFVLLLHVLLLLLFLAARGI